MTGASRGIGSAIAERLARDGFSLALLARDIERLEKVCERARRHRVSALALSCDVRERVQIEAALEQVRSTLGLPDVLVNSAGLGGPFHLTHEVSDEEWELLFQTNVRSVFWFSRALLPAMKERGSGRIINVASVESHFGSPRSSTYAATKHAMLGYTRSIAAEWGPHGITCNAVSPGFLSLSADGGAAEPALLRRIPARRLALPEDVAELVAWLAGERSGYVNGASLVIDGGLTADLGVL